MKEVWKPIRGLRGLYLVSNQGRIKSVGGRKGASKQERILKHNVHHLSGHRRVFFCLDGVKQWRWVHRLVLEAFVGPRPKNRVTAHLDGDPSNNVVSNLTWTTLKENSHHRFAHGTMSCKLSEGQVRKIKKLRSAGVTQEALAAKFGVHKLTIEFIDCGRTWKHIT